MQQPKLPFPRIDAHDAALQRDRIAQEVAALPAASAAPAKRPVGRPKRALDSHAILSAAATATEGPACKKPRGQYTNWFASPYIRDIITAYGRAGGSARAAVRALRRGAPDDRYDRLSHSTVASWFGPDHQLTEKHEQLLEANKPSARGTGFTRVLSEEPAVEEQIKASLLQMRAAGTPLNCRVIGWVMRAIVEEQCPELLKHLTLSQTFVSDWARQQLKWTWRARTTAASKLPADWEQQGVQMAMRVAANMQMYSVGLLACVPPPPRHRLRVLLTSRLLALIALICLRSTLLSSSTWTKPASISSPLHVGPMRQSAAAAWLSWVLMTSARSQPASRLPLTAPFSRFNSSSRARLLAAYLSPL
jgi:hypothetical protein